MSARDDAVEAVSQAMFGLTTRSMCEQIVDKVTAVVLAPIHDRADAGLGLADASLYHFASVGDATGMAVEASLKQAWWGVLRLLDSIEAKQ